VNDQIVQIRKNTGLKVNLSLGDTRSMSVTLAYSDDCTPITV